MKTLHSVIARWTLKDERKSGKSAEPESNESKDKEGKWYCSDKGNNLLSRLWSREEREKQKRNEDMNDNRQCNKNKRNNNMNSSNSEDGEDNISGGGSRKRFDKKTAGTKG
jgi:hypothetical protein